MFTKSWCSSREPSSASSANLSTDMLNSLRFVRYILRAPSYLLARNTTSSKSSRWKDNLREYYIGDAHLAPKFLRQEPASVALAWSAKGRCYRSHRRSHTIYSGLRYIYYSNLNLGQIFIVPLFGTGHSNILPVFREPAGGLCVFILSMRISFA